MNKQIIEGVKVVLSGDAAIKKAQGAQLSNLASKLANVEAFDSAHYDATYSEDVKAAFIKGGSAPEVAKAQASMYKVAALALVNGIKPEKGESLRPYIARSRDLLKASGVYAPKTGTTGGRPKGSTGGAVTAGKPEDTAKGKQASKSARMQAAELLAGKNAELLLWAVADKDAMHVIREMYAATHKLAA